MEEIGSWQHGIDYKIFNKIEREFLLLKKLKKKNLNTREFLKTLRIFEKLRSPYVLQLKDFIEKPNYIELFYEYPEMTTLEIYKSNLKVLSE